MMRTTILKEWKNFQDWLVAGGRTTPSKNFGKPFQPLLTVGLIFFGIFSFQLGNTVPWIVFPLAVILNLKWWFGYLRHPEFLSHPLRVYLFMMIAWLALSASFSPSPAASWSVLWRVLFLAWLGSGLVILLRQLDVERWYSWLIKIICLYCFFGMIHIGMQELGCVQKRGASDSTWVLMLFMPFLIHRFRQGKDRVLILAAMLYPIFSSFYFENRSSVIAVMAIVTLALWFERKKLGRWLIPLFVLVCLSTIFIATYAFQNKFKFHAQAPGEIFAPTWLIDPPRQATWNYVWQLLPDIPVSGFGPNTGRLAPGADTFSDVRVLEEIQPLSVSSQSMCRFTLGDDTAIEFVLKPYKMMETTPHNIFLQWIVELGWIGFCLILGFCILWFFRLLRKKEPIYQYEWMIHGAYFGISFFNTNFWTEWWSPSYFFALFILHALAQGLQKKSVSQS